MQETYYLSSYNIDKYYSIEEQCTQKSYFLYGLFKVTVYV